MKMKMIKWDKNKKIMQWGKINYDLLPEHIRNGTKRYIEEGILPGGFLQAVICNDLEGSFARADATNTTRMSDIVSFFHNESPWRCWGSKERMAQWIERHESHKEEKHEMDKGES